MAGQARHDDCKQTASRLPVSHKLQALSWSGGESTGKPE